MATRPACVLLFALIGAGCVTIAPPAPLVTFGGPSTVPVGEMQGGLGLGSGGSLFSGAHATGMGYFVRWRFGLGEHFDLGLDLIGVSHADSGTLTGKLGAGLGLSEHLRVELGVGAADDSKGKSLNADAALVVGTRRQSAVWNVYGAFRVGGSYGFPGDIVGQSGESTPPNALVLIASLGAAGRLASWAHFISEIGVGPIFVQGRSDFGFALYLGAGVLFDIGGGDSRVRAEEPRG